MDIGGTASQGSSGLPGGGQVHGALLDRAVEQLNAIDRQRGLDYARHVGGYVLQVFFRNRSANFRDHAPEHLSFRALAARTDLEISFSKLYRCVAVELQVREMPVELAMSLSFTHHVILLPVKDEARRVALARQAVAGGWSSRELQLQVRRRAPPRPAGGGRGPGRPPLPAFVKGTRRLGRALDLAAQERITPRGVQHYGRDRARDLLVELDAHLERLGALRASLARALE